LRLACGDEGTKFDRGHGLFMSCKKSTLAGRRSVEDCQPWNRHHEAAAPGADTLLLRAHFIGDVPRQDEHDIGFAFGQHFRGKDGYAAAG